MNKNIFASILATLFFPLLSSITYADMPTRYDSLPHCSSIQNPTAFKDYYLIGYQRYVGAGDRSFSIISASDCLSKGYKFNSFKLLIAPKKYIDSLGIENLKPFDGPTVMAEHIIDSNVQIVDSQIDPGAVGIHSYNLKQKSNGSFYTSEATGAIKNYLLLMRSFLPEFLLTVLIEVLILIIFLRKYSSIRKIVLWSVVINTITFPLVQYFFLRSGQLLLIETCVFVTEAILIRYLIKVPWGRSFAASFAANLTTTIIGLFLTVAGVSLLQFIKIVTGISS